MAFGTSPVCRNLCGPQRLEATGYVWGWEVERLACLRDGVELVSVFSLIWDVRGLFEPRCLPLASLDLSKLSATGLGLQGSKTLINL